MPVGRSHRWMLKDKTSRDGNEHKNDGNFKNYDRRVEIGRFLDSYNQDKGGDRNPEKCNHVENTNCMRKRCRIDARCRQRLLDGVERGPVPFIKDHLCSGCGNPFRIDMQAKVVEKTDDIAAPSRSDRRSSKRIFKNEIPPNDPRENFAEGCVAVC